MHRPSCMAGLLGKIGWCDNVDSQRDSSTCPTLHLHICQSIPLGFGQDAFEDPWGLRPWDAPAIPTVLWTNVQPMKIVRLPSIHPKNVVYFYHMQIAVQNHKFMLLPRLGPSLRGHPTAQQPLPPRSSNALWRLTHSLPQMLFSVNTGDKVGGLDDRTFSI